MRLEERIELALTEAARKLPEDVEEAIRQAAARETSDAGRIALSAIIENIETAGRTSLPLCQDTGMFWCSATIGRESGCSLPFLEKAIIAGCERAADRGFFRKSVVAEPVYARRNTGTNLPPVIVYDMDDGDDVIIRFLLKGFGSENCSSVRMLNPTAGEKGVIEAVTEMVAACGGKPCPPVFLGVGIGGTLDRAAVLAKKAFFIHDTGDLGSKILDSVNRLGIGAGGLGGNNTALAAYTLSEPTHIAGLPVALSVSCWAERKAEISVKGDGYEIFS